MDLRNFYTLVAIDQQIIFRYRFTAADAQRLGLKYPLVNAQGIQIVRNSPNAPRSFEIFQEDNGNPYSLQWTADIQRQIGNDAVLQVGYVGTRGVRILLTHNINNPDRLTGQRPVPSVAISNLRDAGDSSTYHGLQTSFRKRLSHGLLFNTAYTFSKAMAVSQGDYFGGNDPEVQDETNWAKDWGPLIYDRQHVLTTDFAYQLPTGRWAIGGLRRHLLGDWQVGGVMRASTGAAIMPLQASGLGRSRPDYNGRNAYLDGPDRYAYLNPAAITRVPLSGAGLPVRAGNAGKGSLRGPGLWNLDLAVAKSFVFREKFNLRFRAEAFNSTNRVNLGEPILESTRSDYGQVRTVADARAIQMSLRLVF
jgi:hypothetical protein